MALGLTVWRGWVYYAGIGMKVAGVYPCLLLRAALVHAGIRWVSGSRRPCDGGWGRAAIFTTLGFVWQGCFPSPVG